MVNIFKKLKKVNSDKNKEEIINKIRTIKYNRLLYKNKDKKANLVTDIKEDWIIFEDNWISENDKVLYDIYNNKYNILEFCELIIEHNYMWFKTIKKTVACVRINKKVDIGEIFYIN